MERELSGKERQWHAICCEAGTRPPEKDGRKNASDLFITTGFPPAIKIDGEMRPQLPSSR
jgi:hypothetical protein